MQSVELRNDEREDGNCTSPCSGSSKYKFRSEVGRPHDRRFSRSPEKHINCYFYKCAVMRYVTYE